MTWRHLRHAPGLTLLAALTIGLGTGAVTAVFSIVDPLLVRRLPVREPERLVLLHAAGTLQGIDSLSWQAAAHFGNEGDTIEALAAAVLSKFEMVVGAERIAATGSAVSANFFQMLGVRPHVGPIVLGHAAWVRHFGSDPGAVGRTVSIRDKPYTISGVTPPGFFGVVAGTSPDFYLPLETLGRPGTWVHVIARLRPGVTLERALVALDPAFRRVAAETDIPAIEKEQALSRLRVTPAGRGLSAARDELGSRPWALLAIVALALLVASANVAGLVLTRAASRRQEIAVEVALGATRSRIARRWLLEGAGIATLGAIIGLGVAYAGSRALASWLSVGPAPITITPALDWRLLGFAFGLLVLTMMVCGAVPALAAARVDVAQGLRFRAAGLDRGARPSRLRRGLVVAQIAASVTLLSGAGLLVHSVANLHAFDLGFDPGRVLAVTLRDRNANRPAVQADAIVDELVRQTAATPGVQGAAFGSLPPLSGSEIGINIVAEARPSAPPVHTFIAPGVRPRYFETLGLRLAQGDGCPPVVAGQNPSVVINERLAARLFPGSPAVGERVRFVEGRRPPMTIVGVAADSTYVALREEPRNFVYICYLQGQLRSLTNLVLFVRSTADSADPLAGPLRALVQSTDANLETARAQTLEANRGESIRPDSLIAGLSAGFALIAAFISAVGLFGVVTATVVRQTPEIGLRVALGADARGIVRFVVLPVAGLVLAGLVLGIAGAAATASLLSSLLFGLGHVDPVTWAAVALILAAVCAAACAVPVRRALKIDPVTALRAE
jgi:putative ABC transport system permease protein